MFYFWGKTVLGSLLRNEFFDRLSFVCKLNISRHIRHTFTIIHAIVGWDVTVELGRRGVMQVHVTLSVTDEDFGAVWVKSRTLNSNNGSSGITSYSKTEQRYPVVSRYSIVLFEYDSKYRNALCASVSHLVLLHDPDFFFIGCNYLLYKIKHIKSYS